MDLSVGLILMFTFYGLLEAIYHPTKPTGIKKAIQPITFFNKQAIFYPRWDRFGASVFFIFLFYGSLLELTYLACHRPD